MVQEDPSRPILLSIFLCLILLSSIYQAGERLFILLAAIIQNTYDADLLVVSIGFLLSSLIAVFVYLTLKWKKYGLYGFLILIVGSSFVGSLLLQKDIILSAVVIVILPLWFAAMFWSSIRYFK
ncbi:MAG: hypothetical protein H6650_18145 [Ardenticatenales bacterium]|nr:hypothetical protein [Ardenticatenales bacterium]